MIRYLDTSLLVAALTPESETARVQLWLGSVDVGTLAISDWVSTEFSSALSIKLRAGQIRPEDRAAALSAFRRLSASSLMRLTVEPEHFRLAARFADREDLSLRAGDALHLALASTIGATLCTLDRRMAAACPTLGIAREDV